MKKDYEKNLPQIEDMQDEYPKKVYIIVFSIIYICFYCGITRMLLNKIELPFKMTLVREIILNFVLMGIIGSILIFLFRKRLKRDFSILIKNLGTYFKYNHHIFMKYLLFYILSSISIAVILYFKIGDTVSTNELVLSTIPLYITFILGVFFAPIVEEGMFRWCVRKITDKKWVYILLSAFIFGLIHVNYWGMQKGIMILQIIPYSIIGMMFAEVYYNTKNLLASSLFHATWNAVMVILQALLMLSQNRW